ncbi:dihydroorotase [Roseibium sp. TrichSKD4]|uniref:dihydroorotase n=1 Tax=Roseibium sp. TrichSKD4 TaxID=744980 RepID=UPI0001E56121|nr:dihydroorotase [Roseibium sp. TrichSKD4]EFO34388.1 dihydroorotase [Roseibium sp. TrichSKD4]
MAQTYDLILKGGTVVNQDGEGQRDVAVRDGRIVALGQFDASQAGKVIDCTGLHVLPGVIDSQVHFREPGIDHKEDLESGSRAAVMGGVTSVFEMPNTNPLTTTAETLADKVSRAHHRMHCDFAFWVGGTRENVKDIPELERLPAAAGIKVFMGSSTGDLLVEDDQGVRDILSVTRRRAAFHSEDEFRLRERADLRVENDPRSHPVWRDEEAALKCTKRLVSIARDVGAKIHILHLSTAEEVDYLVDHKDVASIEVTPHHLTLTDEAYERLGTLVQMNPPVRAAHHGERLWYGLDQGILDILGSDHAPHLLEEKQQPYPKSPSGMTGVQTLVPIMLDHVNAGKLSLARFVDMTSAGPARLFQTARKGRIAVGYDADFTVVDMKKTKTITNDWIASKCGWTPYDGKTVTGWAVGTIVRGNQIMWDEELTMPSQGEAVLFQDGLPRS